MATVQNALSSETKETMVALFLAARELSSSAGAIGGLVELLLDGTITLDELRSSLPAQLATMETERAATEVALNAMSVLVR